MRAWQRVVVVVCLAAWGSLSTGVTAHAEGAINGGTEVPPSSQESPSAGQQSPSAKEPSSAEQVETPVTLSADAFGEIFFGEKGKRLTAHGNVRVEYKHITLTADELLFDMDANLLYLSGGVTLQQGELFMEGEALEYDLDRERGSVAQASGSFTDEAIDGIVHLSGERVASAPGRIVIHGGSLTTCNAAEPHYHLDARKIEVYPGDRVVIHGVSFWESGIPLFYWPTLVLSLTNPRQNRIQLPQVGYDARDGWFVKSTFNYDVTGQGYGFLYTDWFQRAGVGVGVRHVYEDDATGFGAAELYYRENRLTPLPDIRLAWEQTLHRSEALDFSTSLEYGSRGLYEDEREESAPTAGSGERRLVDATAATSIRYREEGRRLELHFTGDRDAEPEEITTEWELGTELSVGVAERWRLSFDGSAEREVAEMLSPDGTGQWTVDDPETLIDYLAAVEWDGGETRFRLLAEQRLNPDLYDDDDDEADDEAPLWHTVQRIPEMTLSYTGLRAPLGEWVSIGGLPETLPLHATLGLGRFREVDPDGDAEAVRAYAELAVPAQRVPLARDGRAALTAGGSVRPTLYLVEDYGPNVPNSDVQNERPWRERLESVWVLESNVGLELSPFDSLTARFAYHFRDGWGDGTPFRFDEARWRERITGSSTWRSGGWTLSAWGGYRFDDPTPGTPADFTEHWEPVVGRIAYQPSPKWGGELQAAYDIYEARVTDVIGRVRFSPSERLSIQLGAQGDPQGHVERVDADLHFEFSGGWGLSYQAIWDGVDQDFDLGNVSVSKLLQDCRELIFRYDSVDNEAWVEYRITAFPSARVSVGADGDDQELMFDTDTFRELLEDVGGVLSD